VDFGPIKNAMLNCTDHSWDGSECPGLKVHWSLTVEMTITWAVILGVVLVAHVKNKSWFRWYLVDKDAGFLGGGSGMFYNNPVRLLALRSCLALYVVVVTVQSIVAGDYSFRFYTIWNYNLLMIVQIMLLCHTIADLGGFKVPTTMARISWILFQIEMTNVFLVDVVLWTILYPQAVAAGNASKADILNFDSINAHAVNLPIMLVQLFTGRMEMVPAHAVFVVGFALTYVMISWIRKASEPNYAWPYPFLNTWPEPKPWTSGIWYFGLSVAHVLFFFLAYGLNKLKQKCIPKETDQGYCELDVLATSDGDTLLQSIN